MKEELGSVEGERGGPKIFDPPIGRVFFLFCLLVFDEQTLIVFGLNATSGMRTRTRLSLPALLILILAFASPGK